MVPSMALTDYFQRLLDQVESSDLITNEDKDKDGESIQHAAYGFYTEGFTHAMNLFDKAHVTTCLINGRGDCFYGQSRTILSSLTYKF